MAFDSNLALPVCTTHLKTRNKQHQSFQQERTSFQNDPPNAYPNILVNFCVEKNQQCCWDDAHDYDPGPVVIKYVVVGMLSQICCIQKWLRVIGPERHTGVSGLIEARQYLGLQELGDVERDGKSNDGNYVLQDPSVAGVFIIHRLK